MSEKLCTVRFDKPVKWEERGKAYRIETDTGDVVYFPIASTELTEHDRFLDADLPSWIAKKNGMSDLIVAEYES